METSPEVEAERQRMLADLRVRAHRLTLNQLVAEVQAIGDRMQQLAERERARS